MLQMILDANVSAGGNFTPLILIVVGIIVVVAMISFVAKNYIKVPPNKVAIFYGRKGKTKDGEESGFKVVTGGSKFKIPILENVTYLDLNIFSIDLHVQGAPNKDGVPVTLKGVANVKILNDEASLMAACERFLNMSPQQIQDIAFKNLEGHLRGIVGQMTIEELVGDRSKLNNKVLEEASSDLKKLGLGIDLLTIQEVTDAMGYIEQLGKKRTAEVKKDAEIGTAVAHKESQIQTTTAEKDGIEKANENQILIADSNKSRDVKKATFEAEVSKQNAVALNAGPLSDAQQKQLVVVAQAEVEKKKAEKMTEVATAVALQTEQELLSSKIKPAEAEKAAAIATAQGTAQAMETMAEAEKVKKTKDGEGEAAAIRAKMLAEADGIKAKLLAEAEGIEKKAEAYKKLDEAGKTLQILEVAERLVPNAIEKFAQVMAAASKPFESIDKIQIIDFGGNANGGGALSRFGQQAPEMFFKFIASMEAAGIDVNGLAKKIGLDTGNFLGDSKKEIKKDEATETEKNK